MDEYRHIEAEEVVTKQAAPIGNTVIIITTIQMVLETLKLTLMWRLAYKGPPRLKEIR